MPPPSERQPELEALLDYLKRSRGFDFTGYKRTSLTRRIKKRMQSIQIDGFAAYQKYLENNPGEFEELFDTILINVTAFFRDEDAWGVLRREVVPQLIARKGPTEPIRVWSAACASGEEAYSLAILFAEAMSPEAFRERVKIYATDVDEPALMAARHATYAAKDVEGLPPDLVEKYFARSDARYVLRKDLRRSVVFGRNDLIQDAPISRIDLLACRNALMYFEAPTQGRIVSRFFFALNDGGYLFLGRAETLLTHTSVFTPVDLKRRIFQKETSGSGARAVLLPRGAAGLAREDQIAGIDVRDAALRAGTIAQLIVDRQGTLVFANDRASAMFRLGIGDVGRPLSDLDVSYRPVDLRSLIDQAYAERRTVVRAAVEWRPPATSELRWFDVHVTPLHGEDGAYVGTSVGFADVTAQRQLQAELEQSEHKLQVAYEELQSTNEELETTNEELQSTVEELETTNEELHSTNEELETMNEELQSTNEELQTMNDELRLRGDELNQLNRFLEQVFTSLRQGVAVVDLDLRVLVWNRKAEDLWGVRADEVEGAHFLNLDIGLPVDRLRQPIRDALADGDGTVQETLLPATNRRGRKMQCRVVCAPLMGRDGSGPQGVIVIMEEIGAQQ
ncbi:MAG: PAS domain-containing protein [Gemmatimonadota bacterium]|nr:PAS domain-containing protein [Gemmatimonadota bacterium]